MACSGKPPLNLGVSDTGLSSCPDSPNCVSSDAQSRDHKIQAYSLAIDTNLAWQAIREAVLKLPRTKIVTDTDGYLHVECRSAVFGFIDDFELHLRPKETVVAVRSASRVGHSDFGVNRKRVEQLRLMLIEQGVVK